MKWIFYLRYIFVFIYISQYNFIVLIMMQSNDERWNLTMNDFIFPLTWKIDEFIVCSGI